MLKLREKQKKRAEREEMVRLIAKGVRIGVSNAILEWLVIIGVFYLIATLLTMR